MNILLIYELVPSETQIYKLDNLSKENYDKIIACQGSYANADREYGWIDQYLSEEVRIYSHKKQFDTPKIEGKYTLVITGIMV